MSWMTFSLPTPEPIADVAQSEEEFVEAGSLPDYRRVEEKWDQDGETISWRERAKPREKKMSPFDQYCFLVVCPLDRVKSDSPKIRLEIQSKHLKYICRHVIGNREGILWSSSHLRIQPLVFFHYYPRLSDHLNTMRASRDAQKDAIAHLQCLLSFTEARFADQFRELDELIARGEITFDLLKCILLPETVIYTPCSLTREPLACRVVTVDRVKQQQAEYWKITAAYVQATGNRASSDPRFGHAMLTLRINVFQGVSTIHKLAAYPLHLHPDAPEVRKRLLARGRIWEALDGVLHKRYDGVAYTHRDSYEPPKPVLVSSRIMIDRKMYEAMTQEETSGVVVRFSSFHSYPNGKGGTYLFPDPGALFSELSDEDATLTPALVYGFSLEDKQWLQLNVNHITEIHWRDGSFDRLVLPESQKTLIKSLVDAQAANRGTFDDFIEGKGRGLVLNLFGPPGVGKTLSAEATSEHLRRPLYMVGAGDLGTSPVELDKALTRVFKLGSTWRAVVLVDEADVYMEQRSTHDVTRNALVSVFLRQIEYFSGLLFLTTNRVRTFDEAFQSRIHVSLRYYELNDHARRTLWRSFIDHAGGELSPAEEITLAALPLNGRQIKNAVRTADAVASNSNTKVSYGHIKEVVQIMQQFEEDFRDLKAAE